MFTLLFLSIFAVCNTSVMAMSQSLHMQAVSQKKEVNNINTVTHIVAPYEAKICSAEQKEREEKHAASEMQLDVEEREALNKSLRIAAFRNDLEAVETYISCGADVNAGDSNGTTPLMFAVHASPEMIEKLVRNGAAVDKKDFRGLTASNYAEHWLLQSHVQQAKWNIASILTKLVALGSSVHTLDSEQTATYKQVIAAGCEAYDAHKTEIEQLRSQNECLAQKTIAREKEILEQIRLLEAIQMRHEQSKYAAQVQFAEEQLYDAIETKRAIRLQFYVALERGDTELILDIIERYENDKDIFNIPAIYYTISHNNLTCFKYLLTRVADVNMKVQGLSLLEYAIVCGNENMIMMLIDAGAVFTTPSDNLSRYLRKLDPGLQEAILLTVNRKSKAAAIQDILAEHFIKDIAQMIVKY